MNRRFKVVFLEQAVDFLERLDSKTREKIYFNLDKATLGLDPKLFKKLTDDIWEFRTKYGGFRIQVIRILG
jgi:mRNA-degrading endonuclease RelE of RelBE toxin-antitoxin system